MGPIAFSLARTLEGHTSPVLCLSFTKNGRYVLSGSQDKSLKLWNYQNGMLVKTYAGPHHGEVNDVVITEDNSKFSSCGGDKQFFLWDVTTAQVIRKFVGHDRKVNALSWGANEDVLLSASHDRTVRIWDMRARSRTPIQVLGDATDSVLCVCVSGDEIITGSVDGVLRQYDVRKGQFIADQLLQPIGSVSFSRDRQCILVSTLDDRVRLFERESGSELACYQGHSNKRFKVQSVLDPTDAYVISGSEDNGVYFWELVEADMLGSLKGHTGPVLCVQVFESTMVTASVDSAVKVWNVGQACGPAAA